MKQTSNISTTVDVMSVVDTDAVVKSKLLQASEREVWPSLMYRD